MPTQKGNLEQRGFGGETKWERKAGEKCPVIEHTEVVCHQDRACSISGQPVQSFDIKLYTGDKEDEVAPSLGTPVLKAARSVEDGKEHTKAGKECSHQDNDGYPPESIDSRQSVWALHERPYSGMACCFCRLDGRLISYLAKKLRGPRL